MAELITAPDVARRVADALEKHALPYAIGGAIAYGFHAPPRATNDVDVDVFVDLADLDRVFGALESAGAKVERPVARRLAAERGEFQAYVEELRIDVFLPSIPLYASAEKRVRTALLAGRALKILAPEDLALFKLLFLRGKDVVDVERLVAFQGSGLDCAYVRKWLVDLMGPEDERVTLWDRLVAAPPTP